MFYSNVDAQPDLNLGCMHMTTCIPYIGYWFKCFCVADFTPGGDGIPSLCDNATELGIAAGEKCCGSLSYIRTDWEQHQTCK